MLNADGTTLTASVTHFTVFVILQPFIPFAAPTLPSGTNVKPLGIVSTLIPFNGTAPTFGIFTPPSGLVGDPVVITGTGFLGSTSVTFNGVSAAFTVDSAVQISTTVPASATTVPISVTNPAGTATSATDFTVTLPPTTITSFNPTSGPVGSDVVITGTNLTGATNVEFSGVLAPVPAAAFTVDSATQITATVPTGAITGPISVTTPGGAAASATNFTVTVPPPPGPIINTVAGNGTAGFSGDGGPATSASLNNPLEVAVDAAGNLYIADRANNRIRKVDTSGTITTVAGTGTAGFSGDGGPAISASLNRPFGMAVDSAGNLFIADTSNQRVRKVDTTGTITTVAGNGTAAFSGDSGPATSASLNSPAGVAVDSAGNLFIVDTLNQRVRKVNTSGTITTVAGNGTGGFSGDGGPATSASLNSPNDVAVDSAGNLFIADISNHRVRKVDTTGTITTVAGNGTGGFSGDGGPAASASLFGPNDVAVDSAGNLFIAEQINHRIRKVTGGAAAGLTAAIDQAEILYQSL